MSQTEGKQKRSQALIERDLKAYERHMAGLSVRAIGDEIGLKSSQSTWASINRGKQYVDEHGIDVERSKIEIDQLFKNTLAALAEEIQVQRKNGRVTLIERNDGSSEIRRIKGVDPRTAEALARSADRWAQFLGITDRAQEAVGEVSTNVVFVSPTTDGASWDLQATPAVDVSPVAEGDNHPAVKAGGQPVNSAVLMRSAAAGPADLAQDPVQNPDSPTTGGRRRG